MTTACQSLKQSPADQTLWVFEASKSTAPVDSVDGGTVRVERVRVQVPYADTRIVYRTGGQSLKPDPYRRYAAPPSDLLTHQLVEGLQGQGVGLVVGPSDLAKADTRLQLSISEFVLDHSGAEPVARVSGRGLVWKDEPTGMRVLLDKPYRVEQPISVDGLGEDEAMAASMKAMGDALGQLFADLSADMRGTVGE